MGSLTLQAPLFLFLLVPLAVLVGGAWRARRGRRLNRSGSVAIVARCVALLLLIVALAQPAWAGTGTGMGTATPVIFVVDTSARTVGAPRAVEQSWLHDALATLPASALRGLVTFGGSPRLGPAPARADALALASATDPGGTDIASALGLALGAAARGDRLVLLSNGLETTGDARAVAAAASAQGAPIDVVDVGVDQAPDAALTRLQAPASARQGDAIPLLLTVRSTVARRATVALTQDGQPVGQETINLQKGDNPYLVTAPAPGVGWHAYHASVSMAGDTVPQNNALDAVTHVVGPPRLLVVAAGARDGDGSAALLRRCGFTVDLIAPGKTPATMGALDGYDGLVLDDIPATALSGRQIAAIDGAVRVGGMGLLALGGPHSLTLGQYSQSALDHILPVSSVTPGSLGQGAVALQLVLDRSGSMQNLAGGDVPKIQMAQAAANIAVDFTAQHNDDLGIVSFDQDPHILVPIQRVSGQGSAARIHDTVNGLTADGGTDIYDALRVGLSQILRSNAPYKHMILMTDGVSDPVSYTPLLRLLESHQVTLSTVGLGTDADVTLLQMLARVGKGRFYYTNDASALPRIFADEARLSAGSASVAGKIPVLVAASVPAVRAAGQSLPPVRRYGGDRAQAQRGRRPRHARARTQHRSAARAVAIRAGPGAGVDARRDGELGRQLAYRRGQRLSRRRALDATRRLRRVADATPGHRRRPATGRRGHPAQQRRLPRSGAPYWRRARAVRRHGEPHIRAGRTGPLRGRPPGWATRRVPPQRPGERVVVCRRPREHRHALRPRISAASVGHRTIGPVGRRHGRTRADQPAPARVPTGRGAHVRSVVAVDRRGAVALPGRYPPEVGRFATWDPATCLRVASRAAFP